MQRIRVAIDCRITDTRQGIATAVLALATALSESEDTDQEYTFVVPEEIRDWIGPHLFGRCRLKLLPPSRSSRLKDAIRSFAPARRVWQRTLSGRMPVPASDGYVESEGFDVIHFPTQAAYLTNVPSIYQPHDLQHLHYPNFFSDADWALREKRYRAFCGQAAYVCVQTEWTRQDLLRRYGLEPAKTVVVPWGMVFGAAPPRAEESRVAGVHDTELPKIFFFYPAVTWPHKNHEVIFRALRVLKDRHGRTVDVCFTGAATEFRKKLNRLARELAVEDQLHYLGFVSAEKLQSIYRSATAMVFPSKFEGFGLPLLEAFHLGLPVLCANATALPEVAQHAALYFDPDSPEELAALMLRILDDPEQRRALVANGAERLSSFSFRDTAARFQELYALAAREKQRKGDGT
jgi:glycosyltransferase involved in cell wall biosynthesis